MPFNNIRETGRPLTLKDDGVPISDNVRSLDFDGDGVDGVALGDDVTETIPGGMVMESDPIVGAVNGIVKADGAGNISAAVVDIDYAPALGADDNYVTDAEKTDIGLNTTHRDLTNNPHSVNKTDVGLGNVPNIDTTNASNISSGILPSSVLPPVSLTSVQVAVDEIAMLALTTEEGDVVVRSDENKSYMHNGGTTGTMADFTELSTPTDSVLSVNGETGTVVLTTGDIAEDINKNYVTDAEKALLGNTSGVNTGDQDLSPYELLINKRTTFQATPTDTAYITEKLAKDSLDLKANISQLHNAVTVTDSAEIDFTLTGQNITASLKSGSIDETKLDVSVNASLDKADSALQDITGENHHDLLGLSDDDHSQYALLAGRSGGQTLIGGTGTTDGLTLQTTANVGATGADMHFLVGNKGATEAMTILNNGFIGIGTDRPREILDINGSAIIIRGTRTPASPLAPGTAGTICWDGAYLYVCVATNTWARIKLGW